MSWFNIIKNVISVKIYDNNTGMNIPSKDNQGWADWIHSALHYSGRLDEIRHMDKGSIHQQGSGELQTSATFMGVPIIAIYHGTMMARGFPEYLELRQELPSAGIEVWEDIVDLWTELYNKEVDDLKKDKRWADAVTGQYPAELDKFVADLFTEWKRVNTGFLSRFKKPKRL